MQKFVLMLATSTVIAACATTNMKNPALVREPSSNTAKSMNQVSFHDALKTDFEVGSLHLKTYSLDSDQDRKELRAKLMEVLERKDDRLPEEAASALNESVRLLDSLKSVNETDLVLRLNETVEAYNSNFLSPVPRKLWIGAIPYELVKMIHHSIMNERAPAATDLNPHQSSEDLSRVNPVTSTFWQPGRQESSVDMYSGFGRIELPKIEGPCQYHGPKKSYGTHGGFKVECGGNKWKLKFGNESKTEPFNSRLVWALGYNVTVIDYLPPGMKVVYDRKLITEYNSRKNLKMEVTSLLGFTYLSKNLQKSLNPFVDALQGAELEDGTFIGADVLRARLLNSVPQKNGKDDWTRVKEATFNEAYEKKLKYFVLREASVEGPSPKNLEELGSWSWRSLNHADRRELRAFGLIAAWINAFDMRQNNNKVSLKHFKDGHTELWHQVSDLGSGFGDATNLLHYNNGLPNKMPWDLVRTRVSESDVDDDSKADVDAEDSQESSQPWVSPYKFPHYSVIESNPAFSRAQLDDAQWITRKLASFSEQQIQDALIAAGYTATETTLILEKMLDRRQQMVRVFGLESEFPALMARKINRSIGFDPKKEKAPATSGGQAARVTEQKLVNGELGD